MSKEIVEAARALLTQPNGHTSFIPENQILVAKAYLDEHLPDDDEPVTQAWAEANGWTNAAFGIFYGHKSHKALCLRGCDGEKWVWTLQFAMIDIAVNPSRGQVRRLIAAVESPES